MRGQPRRLDRGSKEGAGRALAVGAGDVEDRRQPLLRIAEAGEKGGNPLEAENVGARGQGREPVELMLDGGMAGDGVVQDLPPYAEGVGRGTVRSMVEG